MPFCRRVLFSRPLWASVGALMLWACGDNVAGRAGGGADQADAGVDAAPIDAAPDAPNLTAPETVIDSKPAALTAEATATISFSSPTAPRAGLELVFECATDLATEFTPCTSPVTRDALDSGDYALRVRARWRDGDIDATPAQATWTVDRTAPDTAITAGPMGDVATGTAMFTLSSEPGAMFECRIDDAPFAPCTSPWPVEVTAGDHTFEARAADALGNWDATPASRSYRGVMVATAKVRLMAANITSGNLQSYDPGHGTRIFQGLKPDIVMIQEFNYFPTNGDAEIRAWIDTAFGPTFSYYRESGAQIPNGVISRYPILAAGTWEDAISPNREFVWARIDVPGPKDLWAISVHLLTRDAPTRNSQATALRTLIEANVPTGDYLVIGGDFNTNSRSEACITTFSSIVSTTAPYPADEGGNGNTNAGRAKPYDWVLMDADLRATQTSVVIGTKTFPAGLVFDSRVYTPLSDVAPVLQTDSGATNMQHMGVVVDTLLPL